MDNQSLIHIKLDFEEAVEGKKDILEAEADLLRLLQTMKRYKILRQKELTLKAKLHTKIRTITTRIKKLKTLLPKIKIQEITPKEEKPNSRHLRTKLKTTQNSTQLDRELADIQNKLKELGR